MKFIETVLSIIAFVLFAFCAIVFFVLGTLFGGYVLRYFVYLVCFFVQIFGDYAFVSWVENNETVLYVICCVISALIILLMFSSSSSSSGSYSSSNNYSEDNNASNFWDSYMRQEHTENGEIALLTVKEIGVDGETRFMTMMEIILSGEILTKI